MARTSWITLLAYLAFVMVTLLGVEDADFFVPSRQTQLPLVNVSIPTASFFWFAPALGAALYVYLQLILLKLWDAIADVEAAHLDGHRVGDLLNPWLANDWALILRGGAFVPDRPLRTLGFLATIGLVWLAGPVVLGFAWWRSMPAHDQKLTLSLGVFFAIALLAGLEGCRNAWERLRPGVERKTDQSIWRRPQALAGISLTLLAIGAISWDRTESGVALPLAQADLIDAEMVILPDSWRNIHLTRSAFRETWCKRAGLEMSVCGQLATNDLLNQEFLWINRLKWCEDHSIYNKIICRKHFKSIENLFLNDWQEEYKNIERSIIKINLSKKDLRRIIASNSTFVSINLYKAQLENSNFNKATIQSVNFREAHMNHTVLSEAYIGGADFTHSELCDANFSMTIIDYTVMDCAIINKNKSETLSIKFSSLKSTQLMSSELMDIEIFGSNLQWLRFEGSLINTAKILDTNLKESYFSNSVIFNAYIHRSNLYRARFEDSKILLSEFDNVILTGGNFKNTDWNNTNIGFSVVHGADFRGAKNLMQTKLENVIGDDETKLPDYPDKDGNYYYVWSCWQEPPNNFDYILINSLENYSNSNTDKFLNKDKFDIFSEKPDPEFLRKKFICGPDNPRRQVGTRLPLEARAPLNRRLPTCRPLSDCAIRPGTR